MKFSKDQNVLIAYMYSREHWKPPKEATIVSIHDDYANLELCDEKHAFYFLLKVPYIHIWPNTDETKAWLNIIKTAHDEIVQKEKCFWQTVRMARDNIATTMRD